MEQKTMFVVLAGLGLLCLVSGIPLSMPDFESNILPRCFNMTNYPSFKVAYINGQKYPLASSLDNFINIVEKLEMANPSMKLEEEVTFLLNNFTISNLVYGGGEKFLQNLPSNFQSSQAEMLWDIRGGAPQTVKTDYEIPFTDDEYCGLYYMLSHTFNESAAWFDKNENSYSVSNNANTADPVHADELVGFQRETGVVSVRGTNHTVEMGRVITGLFLAFQDIQRKTLKEVIGDFLFSRLPGDIQTANPVVEPLYALTLVEPLALSMLNTNADKKGLFPDGAWRYIRQEPSPQHYPIPEICPTIYEVPKGNNYMSSYASVRGGIDGLMLGTVVSRNKDAFRDKRLSEVLRQYYSFAGIYDKSLSYPASFCQRQKFEDEISVDILTNHSFAYLAVTVPADPSRIANAIEGIRLEVESKMKAILEFEGTLSRYCASATPSESRNTSCETANDIIMVVDSEKSDYFLKQERIIGYLANMIDLWNNGSTVTVLATQPGGGDSGVQFMPVTSSRACLACQVTQRDQGTGGIISYAKVVDEVDKLLKKKKKEQEFYNGAPGKVVILFNYRDTEPDAELNNALIRLRTSHRDASILAVGRIETVLTKITGDNGLNAIISGVGDDKEVAKKLAEKICEAPAALQYAQCRSGADEDNAVYEGLVSTNAKQYWSMDPIYFEKSYDMEIKFEASGRGEIQVCHNRGSKPDADPQNCEVLPVGAVKTFKHSNPCNGVSRSGCSRLLFSVYGLENKTEDQRGQFCVDQPAKEGDGDAALFCRRLDQISFKVSHKGVRCSGSAALFSCSILVAFALVLCSVFSKIL